MKKILFTGFEPFGKETTNPSWLAVSMLPQVIEEIRIHKLRLPVEYTRAAQILSAEVEKIKPDAVICVGQAGGRCSLTPEMIAINLKDTTAPDNAGIVCQEETIEPEGPAAYFATIPVKKIVEDMKSAGIPASASYSAGTYVCNELMYRLLHDLTKNHQNIKGGFIHVPFACEQVIDKPSTPSLPLPLIADGLRVATVSTVKNM